MTDEAEPLVKEARQRQRRRWTVVVGTVMLAIALVLAGLLISAHGSDGRSAGGSHRTPAARAATQPQRGNGVPTRAPYPPAQSMGLADASLSWATTGDSLVISSDDGSTWKSVTPSNVTGMTVSEHITALDAVGTADLWAVLDDVPGLVPYGQSAAGSDRGQGIDRSTDGGRTWSFVALPGCLQTCGPVSLSFIDSSRGFAATSPQNGDSTLFATQDGGAEWTSVATMPNLGSVAVGGPIAQPQLLFTSTLDGWAVTGPSGYGAQGEPIQTGGALYSTKDGGISWTRASGLPPNNLHYSLPVFFGSGQGVVLATNGNRPAPGAAAYVTQDGGATWTLHALPNFPGAAFEPGNVQTRFSAIGPLSWRIDVGSQLHETDDGGTTWTTLTPDPKLSLGAVSSVAFSSPTNGMAIGDLP
ncbi:MAG TPA: sialidase family protein [Acidimicrobiales bacterium]|nr:sialidase family protein [Acidimicrobiales bacterium]